LALANTLQLGANLGRKNGCQSWPAALVNWSVHFVNEKRPLLVTFGPQLKAASLEIESQLSINNAAHWHAKLENFSPRPSSSSK